MRDILRRLLHWLSAGDASDLPRGLAHVSFEAKPPTVTFVALPPVVTFSTSEDD